MWLHAFCGESHQIVILVISEEDLGSAVLVPSLHHVISNLLQGSSTQITGIVRVVYFFGIPLASFCLVSRRDARAWWTSFSGTISSLRGRGSELRMLLEALIASYSGWAVECFPLVTFPLIFVTRTTFELIWTLGGFARESLFFTSYILHTYLCTFFWQVCYCFHFSDRRSILDNSSGEAEHKWHVPRDLKTLFGACNQQEMAWTWKTSFRFFDPKKNKKTIEVWLWALWGTQDFFEAIVGDNHLNHEKKLFKRTLCWLGYIGDYPPGNQHIPQKWHFEDDFPIPKVGYVNSLEGILPSYIVVFFVVAFPEGSNIHTFLDLESRMDFALWSQPCLCCVLFFGEVFWNRRCPARFVW